MPDATSEVATATATPQTAKQRLIAFASALPDDTMAVDVIVADASGKISNTGLGVGLHTAAAMLISATAGIATPLATEAGAIADAAKLLTSSSIMQALQVLSPGAVAAGAAPVATQPSS